MDLDYEHASILGKKMSPFGRAVIEIFKFFVFSYDPPCILNLQPISVFGLNFGQLLLPAYGQQIAA
jgi:hypothetical protein